MIENIYNKLFRRRQKTSKALRLPSEAPDERLQHAISLVRKLPSLYADILYHYRETAKQLGCLSVIKVEKEPKTNAYQIVNDYLYEGKLISRIKLSQLEGNCGQTHISFEPVPSVFEKTVSDIADAPYFIIL